MYNSELLKAFDEIYQRMPIKWEKWGKPVKTEDEKDLVELLENAGKKHFPA